MPTALVTGGSRGVGRGAVLGLVEAGFKVFATGRSINSADLPKSVSRIPCDHLRDESTALAFQRIHNEAEDLDVLVNSAWGGYERMVEDGQFTWGSPFWQQPMHRWTGMMDAGVRAAFVTSAHAAQWMVPRGKGLIVHISFWAAQKYIGNTIYGVAKAATDKMTTDMADELRTHGITVLSLYPGMVRTEAVLAAAQGGWLDLANSESPEFIGRVIAALYKEESKLNRSGQVVVAADLARQLSVKDIDGSQPRPLTLDTV